MEFSLIQILNKILSTIALYSFIIVVIKFLIKRLKKNGPTFFKKIDMLLMKIHKPAAITLITSGILHGILSVGDVSRIGILPFTLGITCILSIIASAIFFYLKKKLKNPKSWLFYHRLFAVIALISLLGHLMLAK